jgi:hypothetical protein
MPGNPGIRLRKGHPLGLPSEWPGRVAGPPAPDDPDVARSATFG